MVKALRMRPSKGRLMGIVKQFLSIVVGERKESIRTLKQTSKNTRNDTET